MINKLFSDYLDLIMSVGSIIAGILVITISVFFGIHQYSIGFVFIIAGMLYLVFRKKFLNISGNVDLTISPRLKIINNIIFVVLLILSIWMIYSNLYIRPTAYFLVTCAIILSIGLEILYQKKDSDIWLILVKILLVGTIIRISLYFGYSSIYGVDVWFHQDTITDYIKTGNITLTDGQYSLSPTYHLLVTNFQLITGLTAKTATFISVGFVEILVSVFVFLLGKSVFNVKAGLIATLLIIFTDYWIIWGVIPIPQSLGLIYFLIILYVSISMIKQQRSKFSIFIFVVFSVLVILTQAISSFITAITIVFIYLFVRILDKNRSPVFLVTAMLFFIMIVTHWIGYDTGYSFIGRVIGGLKSSLAIGVEFANIDVVSVQLTSTFEDILTQFGHTSLLFLGMIASFIFVSARKRSTQILCLIFTMIVLYFITYAFPLFGMRNILSTRWFAFIYIMVAVLGGSALLHLVNLVKNRGFGVMIAAVCLVTVSFFMITTPKVNPDNPLYADEYAKVTAFRQSEMSAAKSLAGLFGIRSDDKEKPVVLTDEDYGMVYHFIYGDSVRTSSFTFEPPVYDDIIIFREYAFTGTISVVANTRTGLRISHRFDSEYEAAFKNEEYNRVYDNGAVWAYSKRNS